MEIMQKHFSTQTSFVITSSAGSHDPQPAPIRPLLQLPTEERAGLQAGGAAIPQNGVRNAPHV